EEKFIQVNARPIYDDEGNFMRRSEFARDITKSVLRNRELESLNHTVEDVQTATSLSIHYLGADGKHVWTPETYKLIDREPRDSDENHHIILDLATPDERERVQELLDNLKTNEFLALNRTSITTESGILKYIQFDTRKTYDEEGNFVQKSGYAQDITEQVLIEREKELLSQIIAAVLNHLKIGTFTIDSEGKASLSEGFFEVTGIDKDGNYVAEFENNMVTNENIVASIRKFRSSDKKEFEKTIEYSVPGEEEGKFLTIYMVPYYDGENELVIGAIQDVTEQVNYERDLINADNEKTILIKEVHHRVKNNLQVITSFISLEERLRKDDPGRIIDITKKRIASLALIHERIYNEDNMNFISLKDFVHDFDLKLESLSNIPDIEFINDIDSDLSLSLDIITPLVLMINELTTNSFKYAWDTEEYADKYKEIYKSINLFNDPEGKEYCEFIFKDNGRGLYEDFDINSSPSLGWTIIKSFVSQLDGEYELSNDEGLKFVLKFPLPDSK
ncbi:MAG: hypothetical protein MJ203_05920, partial [archaeon]|nr:hypothetical protein [archaeon]